MEALLLDGAKPYVRFWIRYHEEHFGEIILNFNQWFRRGCHLKTFLIYSSGIPFILPSKTICASLVDAIVRNNSVKLF